jgi:hypothetical protein
LRGSTIITNGGSSGPGKGGAFIYVGTFDELVKEMTEADFREAEFDLLIQKHGHKALRNQN